LSYVPLGSLLPWCSAIVHHGGIGTVAQALRAGIPQLITPMNFDQPTNAARVRALGAGDSVRMPRYNSRIAELKLRRLLSDASVRQRCKDLAGRFGPADPVRETCDLIEDLMVNRRVATAAEAGGGRKP